MRKLYQEFCFMFNKTKESNKKKDFLALVDIISRMRKKIENPNFLENSLDVQKLQFLIFDTKKEIKETKLRLYIHWMKIYKYLDYLGDYLKLVKEIEKSRKDVNKVTHTIEELLKEIGI